jgi:hypothetical protein
MEYTILYADTPDVLSIKVRDHMKQNWRPKGGVAVATIVQNVDREGNYKNAVSFFQAMWRDGGPPIIVSTSALYT